MGTNFISNLISSLIIFSFLFPLPNFNYPSNIHPQPSKNITCGEWIIVQNDSDNKIETSFPSAKLSEDCSTILNLTNRTGIQLGILGFLGSPGSYSFEITPQISGVDVVWIPKEEINGKTFLFPGVSSDLKIRPLDPYSSSKIRLSGSITTDSLVIDSASQFASSVLSLLAVPDGCLIKDPHKSILMFINKSFEIFKIIVTDAINFNFSKISSEFKLHIDELLHMLSELAKDMFGNCAQDLVETILKIAGTPLNMVKIIGGYLAWFGTIYYSYLAYQGHPAIILIEYIPPDLNKIAYYGEDKGIWLMNEDGSNPNRIASSDGYSNFYWSPNGEKITFSVMQNPLQISIIDADGRNPITIDYQPPRLDNFSDFSWYPDSYSIVFSSSSGNGYDIFSIQNDGSNLTNLTNNKRGYNYFGIISPDNNHIAFMSNSYELQMFDNLYVMNLNDKSLIKITDIPDNALSELFIHGIVAFPHNISWSPDGSLLAFVGLPNGSPYCGALGTPTGCTEINNLFIASPDGKSIKNITGPLGSEGRYDWSPDGNQIAFETNRDGNWEIYLINTDGTNISNLTNNPFDDKNPSWSPDRSNLVFVSNRDGNQEIYKYNFETSTTTRLTFTDFNESLPAYQPDSSSIFTPVIQQTPTQISDLTNLDLSDPDNLINWFSQGLKSKDISIFDKIISEETLSYGSGMAAPGGRDEITKNEFLNELEERLPSNPNCVGYTINPDRDYIMIWTQGWSPKWDLLGVPSSDVLTFGFSLKDNKIYTTAYFTPDPAILNSPSVKSFPCP